MGEGLKGGGGGEVGGEGEAVVGERENEKLTIINCPEFTLVIYRTGSRKMIQTPRVFEAIDLSD